MSDIEQEIRRQMLAEREAARQVGQVGHSTNGAGRPSAPPGPPQKESTLKKWQGSGGLLGGLATVLLLLAKFGAPLFAVLSKLKFLAIFGKFFLTGGSMLVTMWSFATRWGWPIGAGITLLLFVHECGHAVAMKIRGHKVRGMIFIPFCGALVSMNRGARNVVEDAFIGIMGPIFGTLGGLACLVIYQFQRSAFWLDLALLNFMVNLFNLLPMAPLDGGWITPVFSPKLLALGVILLFLVAPMNPIIWLLAFMSLPRIIGGWKAKRGDAFYQASVADRIRYAVAYLGLAAFLAFLSVQLLHTLELRRPVRNVQPVASSVRPLSNTSA
jgi:Zn-dependent protease